MAGKQCCVPLVMSDWHGDRYAGWNAARNGHSHGEVHGFENFAARDNKALLTLLFAVETGGSLTELAAV